MNVHSSKETKKRISDIMGSEDKNRIESALKEEATLLLLGKVSREVDAWRRSTQRGGSFLMSVERAFQEVTTIHKASGECEG